jgi:hypothetical protein
MRVLVLTAGSDTGGQGIRIRTAFCRFRPDWEVRSVSAIRNYIDHDEDIFWQRNHDDIARLYEQSDVIHVRNTFDTVRRFEKKRRPRPHKPVVIQHHGSMFRTDHRHLMRSARELNAVSLVSTIDLLRYAPGELEWLPIPHDLEALAAVRASATRDPDKIVIHHSPTNRKIKDTDLFEKVGDALMAKYPHVEARVVEKMPWAENVALKAEADIVYDQLNLGWGNNSLEAWAMGIPVVAGVKDPVTRDLMHSIVGRKLPIQEADAGTLYSVLEQLVLSASLRTEAGQRGLRYVRRWHDHERVVGRLVSAYERAAA